MSEPADDIPVGLLLSRINANFFRVNVWICEIELYICYVNNDKQTHNEMTTYRLHTSTSCGIHNATTIRCATIADAINKARTTCKALIKQHDCSTAAFCLDRKRDSFHICSDYVHAYQC